MNWRRLVRRLEPPPLRRWRGRAPGVRILMYHSVADNASDRWATAPSTFAAEMELLAARFTVLSLGDAVRSLAARRCPPNAVVLTFDDGYADLLEQAVPVLERHRLPFTVFALSGAGRESHWEPAHLRKRLLDWEELREVVRRGGSIGSHGTTHRNLTELDDAELARELVTSKETLENNVGIAVDAFAYPWGRFGGREMAAVRRAGYTCALGATDHSRNGPRSDPYSLARTAMPYPGSPRALAEYLSDRLDRGA